MGMGEAAAAAADLLQPHKQLLAPHLGPSYGNSSSGSDSCRPMDTIMEEAAVEEILSCSSDRAGTQLNPDLFLSAKPLSGPGMDGGTRSQADASAASDPKLPFNLALTLALQRARAVRSIGRLASRARIPLPSSPVGARVSGSG